MNRKLHNSLNAAMACSALLTLAIPLSSLAGVWGLGGTWNHPGGWPIDLTALAAVPVLLLLAKAPLAAGVRPHSLTVDVSRQALLKS